MHFSQLFLGKELLQYFKVKCWKLWVCGSSFFNFFSCFNVKMSLIQISISCFRILFLFIHWAVNDIKYIVFHKNKWTIQDFFVNVVWTLWASFVAVQWCGPRRLNSSSWNYLIAICLSGFSILLETCFRKLSKV